MAQPTYTPIQLYHSLTASAVPTAANLLQGELAINIADGKLYYEDGSGVVQVIASKGAGTIGGSTTQIQYNNAGALAGSSAMTFNNSTNVVTLTTLNLTNALGAIYGGTGLSTYTTGDLLYSSASNTLAKLAIGTANYILTVNSGGTNVQWSAPSSISVSTATNLAGGAAGSVPYQSAAATTTFLAIGAADRVMTSSGSAPQWVTSLTSLTGVSSSSITNTSLTSGRVVYSGASGVETDSANLTFNGTTLTTTGLSNSGTSALVRLVTVGDTSFNGATAFAPATPAKLYMGTGTATDTTSAIGATNAVGAVASLAITPIAATNTSVTYTNASTLYIAGAPSAGTNITITNPYALYVNAGASYLGGNTAVTGTLSATGTISGTGTNTWNIQSVGTSGSLVAGGWFYGVNEGLNLSPNGAGLLKRLTISYFNGATYAEALGISNVSAGTGTLSLMNGVASVTSTGLAVAPGVLTLGTDLVYDAFINSPESMFFNVDSDANSSNQSFIFGTDRAGTTGGTEFMRISGATGGVGAVGIGYSSLTSVGNNGLAVLGNVGIGTSSPTAKLQISVASAAVNGTKGVRITNPAGTIVMLECGSGGDSFVGTESGSTFNIRTNNAIHMTFLNGGNVGIGETNPTQILHLKGSSTTYALAETTGSGTSSGFRMKAGAGTDFTLYTTQGGNQFGIYNNTTSTQPLTINANGVLALLGASTSATGVGITFPATQSASTDANTLDDYEEGTWTPTLSFDIGQSGNFTYSTQTGFYTVIGNTAVIYFTIACTAIPVAGGILKISSPFATALTTTKGFVSSVGGLTFTSRNLGAGGTQVAITNYSGVLAPGILGSGRGYTDIVDVGALTAGFNISGCVIINF